MLALMPNGCGLSLMPTGCDLSLMPSGRDLSFVLSMSYDAMLLAKLRPSDEGFVTQ